MGNLINPRYRGNTLKKLGIYDEFVRTLIDDHPSTENFVVEQGAGNTSEQVDLDANIDTADFYQMMALNDGFDPHNTDDPDNSQNMPDLERELKIFLSLPPVSIDESKKALTWWKAHSKTFPLLAELARNVLCIPAASASSERVFSASGNIITCTRHNLSTENAKKLTLIKVNYEYIKNYIELAVENLEEPIAEEPKNPMVPQTPGTKRKGIQEPKPSTSKSQPKQTTQTRGGKRTITYSSTSSPTSESTFDTDSATSSDMDPPPAPRHTVLCSPPKAKRVTRRSSASDSDSESQSLLMPPSKRLKRLSASDILNELDSDSQVKSPLKKKRKVKDSADMFEEIFNDDDDVGDPSYKPQ